MSLDFSYADLTTASGHPAHPNPIVRYGDALRPKSLNLTSQYLYSWLHLEVTSFAAGQRLPLGILIVEQQTIPNTGNLILLVLAVCGAIADNRYKARGGKKAPKGTVLKLAVAFSILLVVFGLRDASLDSIIYLAVTFFVLGFAGYETWRWFVRKKNPVPKWK